MNFKPILLLLIFFKVSLAFSEPNVLKCNKNCGNPDISNNYTFQARIAMGPDKWGANVTFIEDDIILSQGHILGYSAEEKNSIPRCGSDRHQILQLTGCIIKMICTWLLEKIIL